MHKKGQEGTTPPPSLSSWRILADQLRRSERGEGLRAVAAFGELANSASLLLAQFLAHGRIPRVRGIKAWGRASRWNAHFSVAGGYIYCGMKEPRRRRLDRVAAGRWTQTVLFLEYDNPAPFALARKGENPDVRELYAIACDLLTDPESWMNKSNAGPDNMQDDPRLWRSKSWVSKAADYLNKDRLQKAIDAQRVTFKKRGTNKNAKVYLYIPSVCDEWSDYAHLIHAALVKEDPTTEELLGAARKSTE